MALIISAAALAAQSSEKAVKAEEIQSAASASASPTGAHSTEAIPPGAIPAMRMGPSVANTQPHPDGIDVRGRIEIREPKGTQDQTIRPITFEAWLIEQVPHPKPPTPENWDSLSREERINWNREFFSTDAGLNFVKEVNRIAKATKRYHVSVEEDGIIVVEGVLPGSYVFQATAFQREGAGNQMMVAGRAHANLEVTRDKSSGDLGALVLQLVETVGVGQVAPDFEVETVEGKKFKLSDFNGRYVVLDFWATWCGPCIAETPNLRAAHEEFGGDRFEIIGLSLDSAKREPMLYAKKKRLKWVNGFLGPKSAVAARYGVSGIPSIWLIDPNGKVVEKDLRGTRIIESVREALRE